MNEKLPNFLLVGAAKSGTTSLYFYLDQHPEIYMSPVKEPRFFTSHLSDSRSKRKKVVKSLNKYKKLFINVKNETAIGEASPDTLYYYKDSIKYIKKYLGNPKIIIILRNPLDRAVSAYYQLKRDGSEKLSFEDAIKEEKRRIEKGVLNIWRYVDAGLYYNQVKGFLENFTNVKIVIYDDFINNPYKTLSDIYKFLSVDPGFKPDINTKYNVSGIPTNKYIDFIFKNKKTNTRKVLRSLVLKILGDKKAIELKNYIGNRFLVKPEISPEIRSELNNRFRDDVLKLQDLIDRDLSRWLN